MKQIIKTYNQIINQWAKALYTPKQLLQYLSNYITKYNKNNFMLQLSLNQTISFVNISKYKFSKQFLNIINKLEFLKLKYNINSVDDFILVGICDATNKNSINNMIKGINIKYFDDTTIYNAFSNDNFPPAESFSRKTYNNISDFLCGIKIILNRNCEEDFSKYQIVQSTLDHQFNHFFKKLNANLQAEFQTLQRFDEVQYVAKNLHYELNKDFCKHMYEKSQFISMCSDTCNNIEYYLKQFYPEKYNIQLYQIFLKNCQKEQLLKDDYYRKNNKLINSYLFGYICKTLDNKRWNFLCDCIKEQLNL